MSQTELKKVRASATLFNGHALQVNEGKELKIGFGLVTQVFCPAKHSRFVSAAHGDEVRLRYQFRKKPLKQYSATTSSPGRFSLALGAGREKAALGTRL